MIILCSASWTFTNQALDFLKIAKLPLKFLKITKQSEDSKNCTLALTKFLHEQLFFIFHRIIPLSFLIFKCFSFLRTACSCDNCPCACSSPRRKQWWFSAFLQKWSPILKSDSQALVCEIFEQERMIRCSLLCKNSHYLYKLVGIDLEKDKI